MIQIAHLVLLAICASLTLADPDQYLYNSNAPPPPVTVTHTQIMTDGENVDVPAKVTRFCHKKCGGACEACCEFDYHSNNNYDELCHKTHGDEKATCHQLLGVIDFICTKATYKYSVVGTTQPFTQQRVFPNLVLPTPTPTPADDDDDDSYSSYGDKDDDSYGDKDDYSHKKRALQQTTNYGNLMNGNISKTCITCPRKKRGYGYDNDDDDYKYNHHHKYNNPALQVPDHEVFVCGNPYGALELGAVPSISYDEGYYYWYNKLMLFSNILVPQGRSRLVFYVFTCMNWTQIWKSHIW